MLRELDLAVPISITYTKKQLVEVTFRKVDAGVVCIATYRVPNADGSQRLETVRKPISAVLTTAQINALLDKVVL